MNNKKHKARRRGPQPGEAPRHKWANIPTASVNSEPTIIKPIDTPAIGAGPGKYRTSGHLVDIALKATRHEQLELFSDMSPETQELLRATGADIEFKNSRGDVIKYTPGENLLLFFTIPNLLHQKSQITDPSDQDSYYMGNKGTKVIRWDTPEGELKAIVPLLGVKEYDIAKAYKGGEPPSGRDIEIVRELINGLENNSYKRALISYPHIEKISKERTRKYTVIRYEPLVRWIEIIIEDVDTKTGKVIAKKSERVIALHPVYRSQIAEKYVNLPEDIVKRLIAAYGSHKIAGATQKLLLYLARELSAKRYTPFIGLDNAYNTFTQELYLQGRKADAKKALNKALETIKAVGLLLEYEIKPGVRGPILYWHLNKDWH